VSDSPGPVWDSLVADLGEPERRPPIRRLDTRPPVPVTGPQPAVRVPGGATAVSRLTRAESRRRMAAAEEAAWQDDQPTTSMLLTGTDARTPPAGDRHQPAEEPHP